MRYESANALVYGWSPHSGGQNLTWDSRRLRYQCCNLLLLLSSKQLDLLVDNPWDCCTFLYSLNCEKIESFTRQWWFFLEIVSRRRCRACGYQWYYGVVNTKKLQHHPTTPKGLLEPSGFNQCQLKDFIPLALFAFYSKTSVLLSQGRFCTLFWSRHSSVPGTGVVRYAAHPTGSWIFRSFDCFDHPTTLTLC